MRLRFFFLPSPLPRVLKRVDIARKETALPELDSAENTNRIEFTIPFPVSLS